jgi:hypothetical protein
MDAATLNAILVGVNVVVGAVKNRLAFTSHNGIASENTVLDCLDQALFV